MTLQIDTHIHTRVYTSGKMIINATSSEVTLAFLYSVGRIYTREYMPLPPKVA